MIFLTFSANHHHLTSNGAGLNVLVSYSSRPSLILVPQSLFPWQDQLNLTHDPANNQRPHMLLNNKCGSTGKAAVGILTGEKKIRRFAAIYKRHQRSTSNGAGLDDPVSYSSLPSLFHIKHAPLANPVKNGFNAYMDIFSKAKRWRGFPWEGLKCRRFAAIYKRHQRSTSNGAGLDDPASYSSLPSLFFIDIPGSADSSPRHDRQGHPFPRKRPLIQRSCTKWLEGRSGNNTGINTLSFPVNKDKSRLDFLKAPAHTGIL